MKAIIYIALVASMSTLSYNAWADGNTGEETTGLKPVEELDCSKTGPDENKMKEQYSLYREFYKQKNYKDAVKPWRWIYNNASGFRETPFIDGVNIYEAFAKEATDKAQKAAFLDTMFMVYDARMKCFGRESDVLMRKAIDMYKYRSDDVEETYALFKEGVDLGKDKSVYFGLAPYFSTAIKKYVDKGLTDNEMIDLYFGLMDIVAANKDSKKADKYAATGEQLDDMMSKLNLLTCDLLKPKLQAKYDADPSNQELWEKIYSQMKAARCATDPLFVEVTEKLFAVKPDEDMARYLALNFMNMKEYDKALFYYNKAIELTQNADDKAEYLLSVARLQQVKGDYASARSYAYKAAESKGGWGDPYILIGDLYQGSGKKCGPGTGWDSQVVTWAAVDMYQKAKAVDASVADKANDKIANSTRYMPSKEECFFRSFNEGDEYKIECWINVTTTVRFGPSQ